MSRSRIKYILKPGRNKRLNSRKEKGFTVTRDLFTVYKKTDNTNVYSLNGFSTFSQISSAFWAASQIPAEWNYHFFFRLNVIVPFENPSCMQGFQI